MNNDLLVLVTVYKEILCIETLPKAEHDDSFIPAGNGKIGCILIDTKGKLGISAEAKTWLDKVPRSGDDIGDVDAFKSKKGGCFGWLGGVFVLKDLTTNMSGSRNYDIDAIDFEAIPNDTPKEAKEVIDTM